MLDFSSSESTDLSPNPEESSFTSSDQSKKSPKPLVTIDATNLITFILVALCLLASLDLWRQYAISTDDYMFYEYSLAVRSSESFWKLGFHLEDLEHKIQYQQEQFEYARKTIGTLNPPLRHSTIEKYSKRRRIQTSLSDLLGNESSIYQIRCGDKGNFLRVGVNDFRADPMDMCQIFANAPATDCGPHTMWQKVDLGEESFGLRNVGSDLFIQVVAPPSDNAKLPWKLVLGGPIAGAAERFRITSDGLMYSPLVGGMLQCDSGQMVKGYPGAYSSGSTFLMEKVPPEETRKALELAALSRQLITIQNTYTKSHQSSLKQRKENVQNELGSLSNNTVHICIAVPMTSKGTVMKEISESPFWANLFDSFMKTIDWRSNRMVFKFYLGFDKADDMYDTGDAWSEFRELFTRRATYRMQEQLMDKLAVEDVLNSKLALKLMHFDHLEGAPTQVVSQLVLQAFTDNFDYFYQVNDDTILITANWAPRLVEALAANPSIPNFGVAGPVDTNNDKIFTHSFVHRTHIEVLRLIYLIIFSSSPSSSLVINFEILI